MKFPGLNELQQNLGLVNELKLYRMSKGIGGKTENFALTTDGQRQATNPARRRNRQLTKRYLVFR